MIKRSAAAQQLNRVISVPIKEDLYKRIEQYANMQNGGNIQDCLNTAISEAVESWDDYDKMISSLKIKEKVPIF